MRQHLTPFLSLQVRSTTETSGTGTRNAIPVSFPFSSGITFPNSLSSTCRCWNYILMSSAAITPFLGWRKRENKLSSNIMYFSTNPWFISQNVFAINNLHWIVSKIVGENLLKFEHTSDVSSQKNTPCVQVRHQTAWNFAATNLFAPNGLITCDLLQWQNSVAETRFSEKFWYKQKVIHPCNIT